MPLCDECTYGTDESKPSGNWGFLNHTHVSKPEFSDKHENRRLREDLASAVEERDRLREALQKAETVVDLMADVVTYDATMQGPKILGVNGSAARRASEAARDYFIAKDRVKP
jgi:hypothetical protein